MFDIKSCIPWRGWTRTNHSPVLDDAGQWTTNATKVVVKNMAVAATGGLIYGAVRHGVDIAMASVSKVDTIDDFTYGVMATIHAGTLAVGWFAGVNFLKKYGAIKKDGGYLTLPAVAAGLFGSALYVGLSAGTFYAAHQLFSHSDDGLPPGNLMSELPGPLVGNLVASICSKAWQGLFEPVGPRLAAKSTDEQPNQGQVLAAAESTGKPYPADSNANKGWNEPIKFFRCLFDSAPRASLLGIPGLTHGWQVIGTHAGVGAAAGVIDGAIDISLRSRTDPEYTDVKKKYVCDFKAWCEKNTWYQFAAGLAGALSQAAIGPTLASITPPSVRPLMYAIANCSTNFFFVERFKDEMKRPPQSANDSEINLRPVRRSGPSAPASPQNSGGRSPDDHDGSNLPIPIERSGPFPPESPQNSGGSSPGSIEPATSTE